MRGLNLGYDTGIVRKLSVAPRFQAYVDRLANIDGTDPVSAKAIDGVGVRPDVLALHQDRIIDAIGELISGIDAAR